MSYATDLQRIIRRLQNSSGRRVARRNALYDLDILLKRVRRELRKEFLAIGKDGKEIRRELLPKGSRRCPADNAYVKTAGEFAAHVLKTHKGICWCGFKPKCLFQDALVGSGLMRGKFGHKVIASLRAHFERVKHQLKEHVTLGALEKIGSTEAMMTRDSRATIPYTAYTGCAAGSKQTSNVMFTNTSTGIVHTGVRLP